MTLAEAGVELFDCEHKTPPRALTGRPYLMIPEMKSGRLDLSNARLVDEDSARIWNRRVTPREGDIVLSRRTNPGVTAVIPPGLECVLGQNLVILRARPGARLDQGFLRWLVRSPAWWDQVRMFLNVGAVFDSLRCRDIPRFELLVPPMPAQQRVARILGSIDDKIELNRQMSATLEEMARALFKSWFVDFDPVHAKAEGRDTGLPKELADLFPDSFEDSELGEIPKGWGVGVLSDIVELQREQVTPAATLEQVFTHFSLPAFDNGQRPVREAGANIRSNKFVIPQGAVLLSKLNPSIERVWLVDVQSEDSAICSTEFLVLLPQPPFGSSFAYCLLRSPEFRQQLQELVTGTSNSHQRAPWREILALQACVPTEPIAISFAGLIDSLFLQAANVRRASGATEALRDLLLPPLVSGAMADRRF